MKQTFMLAMALSLATALSAQTTQGTFALGFRNFAPVLSSSGLLAPTNAFGIGFGKTVNEGRNNQPDLESNYFSLGLSASGHYFLINNLSLGVNVNFFSQSDKNDDLNSESKLSLLMAGPELRYYIPISTRSSVFIRAQGSFGTAKSEFTFDGDNEEDESKLSTYGAGAGLALFLRPNFSLDLGAGYSVFRIVDESTFAGQTEDDVTVNSGAVIDVGFTFFFGGQ